MYQHLFNLCRSFLAKEASVINRINVYQGNVHIEQDALVFSLADLFDFLSQSCEDKIVCVEFQRQLYQSTLNQDLKVHGGQVVVHHSTGKVETNLYRLERCSPADPIL